jgi:hypothetical protein
VALKDGEKASLLLACCAVFALIGLRVILGPYWLEAWMGLYQGHPWRVIR